MGLSGFDIRLLLHLDRDALLGGHEPRAPFRGKLARLAVGRAEVADDADAPIAATRDPDDRTQTELLGEDFAPDAIAVPVGIAGERMDVLVYPGSLSHRAPPTRTRLRGGG